MQNTPVMSVPQFGGWDQRAPGDTDYSMVFTQARANKKHQKTNITEIKPVIVGNEGVFSNSNHGRAHGHGRGHGQTHTHEDPGVMVKQFSLFLFIALDLMVGVLTFYYDAGKKEDANLHKLLY